MIKRIAIAVTTAAAFLFSFSAGAAVAGHQHTAPVAARVSMDGCPAPLHMAPDGTCWP
jgi:hypothetical protein